ncbi:hypothetical protein MY8738_005445 [Beauveria namnaoensis]
MNDPEQDDDATHQGFDPALLDDGDLTDSGDESEDSQKDVNFQGDCLKACEPPFRDRREAAFRRKQRIKRLRAHLNSARERLSNTREQLRQANRRLRDRTWREELAKCLLGQRGALKYGKIVKMATWEENGSYTYLHPGLKLHGPSKADLKQYEKWNEWMAKYQAERQARQPATGSDLNSRLPVQVLGRILRNLLVFDGQPIHVVSRLDPHYGPDPGLVNGSLRLLNRFHIGNASFSLTCEMPPQVLLAPLSVCKQWNYIGSNLFYSLNNFCFSSLGE